MLTLEQALAQLLAAARPVAEIESLATEDAGGRILARAQRSRLDVPPLDNSAMDGYALRACDVPTPGTRLPVAQRIAAGSVGARLDPGTAARIFTGAPLPEGADAVVMQEQCRADADGSAHGNVSVDHLPAPGDWIRRRGEDIARGGEILAAGTRLMPAQLGLAAAIGTAVLPVFRRLRVALFSTGDELVMPGTVTPEAMPAGAIYNSNRALLIGLLRAMQCQVADLGIVPDSLAATREALRRAAAGNDLIISSGGVSTGEEDHVKPAVSAEGSLDLWKIAIKPGKPLAYGSVASASFIGLPGNPVSSLVTFLLLVRPFILKAQGATALVPRQLTLRADFDWPKPDARREFLRVRRNEAGGLDLFANQNSSVLTSVVWADGLLDNPPGKRFARGDAVSFLPFSELLY